MENFMSQLSSQVLELVGSLVIGIVGLYFMKLRNLISTKVQNEQLKGVLLDLSEKGEEIVLELEDTLVKEMKKKSQDGRLSQEEIDEINEIAVSMMKNRLSMASLDFIQQNSDDIEEYILGKLRATNASFKLMSGSKATTLKIPEIKESFTETNEEEEIVNE
jgi:hypothetical protein